MNEISKKDLKELFDNDDVFMNVGEDMKTKMLEAFPENKVLDLDFVSEQKVGRDFLHYLIDVVKVPNLEKYFSSLWKYLIVIALLNNRKHIVQSDLMLLVKVKMDTLGIENWENIINREVKETMFKKFMIPLDQNNDLKDELGEKLDTNSLTAQDVLRALQQRNWLDEVIPQIEANIPVALKTDQLQNIFYQDEITNTFKQYVDTLLRRMKYQRLSFNIVVNAENR